VTDRNSIDAIHNLFENNRRWVAKMTEGDPDFFKRLSRQQSPQYLWIGCADSRVPANQIVGLLPGEMFVHRNVSNVVSLEDSNCLAVVQFAVDVLQVQHIIVCGHYGCGGVQAALEGLKLGLSDIWLRYVREVRDTHLEQLNALPEAQRFDRLCELNVVSQVFNVARTSVLRDAWSRGQSVSIHGWIYAISNGLLRDLGVSISAAEEAPTRFEEAVQNLSNKRDAQQFEV